MEKEIAKFRMMLLGKMPFYGDVVSRLPFRPNDRIPTARTDGGCIEYNPAFFKKLSEGERHFVLMHEILHVILFHCSRMRERDPGLWNTAADMVVNSIVAGMIPAFEERHIPLKKPSVGIFAAVTGTETAENVYERLKKDNPASGNTKTVLVRENFWSRKPQKVKVPGDLTLPPEGTGEAEDLVEGMRRIGEEELREIIRQAAIQCRSAGDTAFVPNEVLRLIESKRLSWKELLQDYLSEAQSEEASYLSPERKYLHRGLILPGYGKEDTQIEEIWAFVDSSGSIGQDAMMQFLTQLWRISKEFSCTMHIAYWNTEVSDVYRNIRRKEDILNCKPMHSGGTDINCVYRWMKDNKINPEIMLILTDGYYGNPDPQSAKKYRGKTIQVLSGGILMNDIIRSVGKPARL